MACPIACLALVACWLILACPVSPSRLTMNNKHTSVFFAPRAADDFKRRPIFELTKYNGHTFLQSKQCTLLFTEATRRTAPDSMYRLALRAARMLRDEPDIMVAHAMTSALKNLPYFESRKRGKSILPRRRSSRIIMVGDGVGNGNDPEPFHHHQERNSGPNAEADWLRALLEWVGEKCSAMKHIKRQLQLEPEAEIHELLRKVADVSGQLTSGLEAADDARDLSVIFKTNRTLALLNDDFNVDNSTKLWAKAYCKEYEDVAAGSANKEGNVNVISRLDAKNVTMKHIYCSHLLAGRPFILQGVTDDWQAVKEWGSDRHSQWPEILGMKTNIQVDNGLEGSWGGSMTVTGFKEYLDSRNRKKKVLDSRLPSNPALEQPPWSTMYAYVHQHSRLYEGRHAAFRMWQAFGAPEVLDKNNWFKLMGECFKMMTVTFWAPHGARQSNHQDDFGSSKWQAQIFGRKRWIMHPPEQSSLLYNGLVDPFSPDLERYPKYAEATPLDFILEPGEVLFWSAGWWHATLSLEDSVAIAQNVLNEHNYEEFRRTSQSACLPDGSHGIHSPWCACFRRCYATWDKMYEKWRRETSSAAHYLFHNFSDRKVLEALQCCDKLSNNGIEGVLNTHSEDRETYFTSDESYEAVLRKVQMEEAMSDAAAKLKAAGSQQRMSSEL